MGIKRCLPVATSDIEDRGSQFPPPKERIVEACLNNHGPGLLHRPPGSRRPVLGGIVKTNRTNVVEF